MFHVHDCLFDCCVVYVIIISEGMLYNITTGEVRDSAQLQQREQQQQTSLGKKRTPYQVERTIRVSRQQNIKKSHNMHMIVVHV
jgi:hypothetical protein